LIPGIINSNFIFCITSILFHIITEEFYPSGQKVFKVSKINLTFALMLLFDLEQFFAYWVVFMNEADL